MLSEYIRLLPPVFGMLLNVGCQFISCRHAKISLTRSLQFAYALGAIATGLFDYMLKNSPVTFNDNFFLLLVNFITYSCFSFCYFCLVGLGFSLRMRLLDIINRYPAGLPYQSILDEFNSQEVFEKRIDRLIQNQYIEEKNGQFHLKKSVLPMLTNMNTRVKKILTGKGSEFE